MADILDKDLKTTILNILIELKEDVEKVKKKQKTKRFMDKTQISIKK